ncbi:hypothetical protein H257_16436 [Aphanomyces astaci]|uniref:Uncharacterized protein n=1 Tax=Aphanomyces astaci TaxID=112090 RepID=W4FIK4_APHAT|nr:hypothetical protein H257_16436 [Aphanomyces astaci]ETV67352.1 hypothetical protein H257_16436 [Aphanomyces astaci]|eukprot:XP_009843167.1 hypothetical protein H257_16436 [Aphanomyces astaci]
MTVAAAASTAHVDNHHDGGRILQYLLKDFVDFRDFYLRDEYINSNASLIASLYRVRNQR